jgi:hypothetical protein
MPPFDEADKCLKVLRGFVRAVKNDIECSLNHAEINQVRKPSGLESQGDRTLDTIVSMRLKGYSPPLQQPFRDVAMVFVALTPLP